MLKMPITILINSTRTLRPHREHKQRAKGRYSKGIMKFQTRKQNKQQQQGIFFPFFFFYKNKTEIKTKSAHDEGDETIESDLTYRYGNIV